MNFIGFVTLHIRGDVSKSLNEILEIVKMKRVAIVIPEPYGDGPQRVAKYLYQIGLNCRVIVVENLTYENEIERQYDSLLSLINDNHTFSDLTIMAIFLK